MSNKNSKQAAMRAAAVAASGFGLASSLHAAGGTHILNGVGAGTWSAATQLSTGEIVAVIPEPATFGVISMGLVGLLMRRRRRA